MKTTSCRIALGILLVLAALILTGCGPKQQQQAVTEMTKQTYQIDPTGSLRIRHLTGSISIRGADINELHMEAVKRAGSAGQLANLKISVVAQDDTVTITTTSVRQKNRARSLGSGSVDYSLVVPRTIRVTRVDLEDGDVMIDGLLGQELRVNVVDGKLSLRNCCSNLNATIANGEINFSYLECDRKPFSVVAQIMHGDATVLIPREASLRIQAETGVGKIFNEFAETVELNGQTARRLHLARGSEAPSEIKLLITAGDIRIGEHKSAMENAADPANLQPASEVVSSGR